MNGESGIVSPKRRFRVGLHPHGTEKEEEADRKLRHALEYGIKVVVPKIVKKWKKWHMIPCEFTEARAPQVHALSPFRVEPLASGDVATPDAMIKCAYGVSRELRGREKLENRRHVRVVLTPYGSRALLSTVDGVRSLLTAEVNHSLEDLPKAMAGKGWTTLPPRLNLAIGWADGGGEGDEAMVSLFVLIEWTAFAPRKEHDLGEQPTTDDDHMM